nr:MAG TPA: baseplate wedge protein [Caudoviricetes sp.]DAQ14401.1 MAG TPA: baseplate wedge protein [Caudoviricetes sp.]
MINNTYKTILGDTWDLIAFKVYGTEKLFPLLMEANPQEIGTLVFSADTVLNIPPVNTELERASHREDWRNW